MLRGKKRTTSGHGILYRTMGDGTNLGSVQPMASTRVREATGRKHARCTQKRNNNDNASLAESRTSEGTMPSSSELLTRRDIPSLVGEIVNYLSVGNGPPTWRRTSGRQIYWPCYQRRQHCTSSKEYVITRSDSRGPRYE